jgi:single-strand DNA-binding protein
VSDPEPIDRNEVQLVGRVSSPPTRRTLPSGDEVVQLRVVVRRAHEGVDTLDVTVGPAPPSGARRRPGQTGRRLLGAAEQVADGARVRIEGELRRRWWGSGRVRQSRVEVRAHHVVPVAGPDEPGQDGSAASGSSSSSSVGSSSEGSRSPGSATCSTAWPGETSGRVVAPMT